MTVTERDELAQFLAGLHQTRLAFENAYASSRIRETVAMNPQGQYALALRCILLEKELLALRSQAGVKHVADADPVQTAPVRFLGVTLRDWNVNAKPLPKPGDPSEPAVKPAIPAYLMLEEKAIHFLGNNSMKVWTFILFLTFLVVHFKG